MACSRDPLFYHLFKSTLGNYYSAHSELDSEESCSESDHQDSLQHVYLEHSTPLKEESAGVPDDTLIPSDSNFSLGDTINISIKQPETLRAGSDNKTTPQRETSRM